MLYFLLTLLILWLCLGCTRAEQTPPPKENNALKTESIQARPASEKPDLSPPSLPPAVYQDSDGSVYLSPLTARLIGNGLDLNEWDQIAGFKNREQRVIWQAHLSIPGTYKMEVDTICTGPTQEAKMRVYVGETRFGEGLIQLSDNDQTVATTSLGEITLDAPQAYRVEVEMVGLPLIGKFAISEVRLAPVEENASGLPRFKTNDQQPEGN